MVAEAKQACPGPVGEARREAMPGPVRCPGPVPAPGRCPGPGPGGPEAMPPAPGRWARIIAANWWWLVTAKRWPARGPAQAEA